MNQIVVKWVEALRSGEYEQGFGQLNSQNKFCCLGVLCDLHSKEKQKPFFKWHPLYDNSEFTKMSYCNSSGELPRQVQNWAQLQGSIPEVIYNGKKVMLSVLNDTNKLNFNEIADLIEAKFLKSKNIT